MSLHLNQQCQRADAHPPPVRLVPGIGYTDQEEARNERRPVARPRPLLEPPYMDGADGRQPAFCNIAAACRRHRSARRVPPRLRAQLEMGSSAEFSSLKALKMLALSRRSSALDIFAHRLGLGLDPLHA